jgi:type IV pilus assembly protein PilV
MSSNAGSLWRDQRGAGLIEVLVAVLVLSFGMLGLAGLQMSSLRNNQSSMERGIAVMQTHAIADAMRADRIQAMANAFNIDYTDAVPTGTTFAARSVAAWRTNLTNSLGAGAAGKIDCNGSSLCTITIRWSQERVTGVANETQSIVTEVQL